MRLNTKLIIERRNQLGLPRLVLARRLGINPLTMRRIEEGQAHGERSLRFVEQLAEQLGVDTISLLLTDDEADPRPPAQDDVKLEAALASLPGMVHRDEIAGALGWDLERTNAAIAALKARLEPTGVRLQPGSWGRYDLRAREDVLSQQERQALARARAATNGLTLRTARVLREAIDGQLDSDWERSAATADRIAKAELLKQGLVHQAGQLTVPTEELTFSLLLDEAQPTRGQPASTASHTRRKRRSG